MVAYPEALTRGGTRRFHGDQVDPDRQSWDRPSIGQAVLEQPANCRPQVGSLTMVERLLGKAEIPSAAPANFDDDQARRRTRVDRHEIELVATDMDVPGQDGPTFFAQPSGDQLLGGVTRQLSGRSTGGGTPTIHSRMIAGGPHRTITRLSPATLRRLYGDFTRRYVAASSRRSRSTMSSVASSAITGTSSRSRRSWVDGDADGSPSRSRSS